MKTIKRATNTKVLKAIMAVLFVCAVLPALFTSIFIEKSFQGALASAAFAWLVLTLYFSTSELIISENIIFIGPKHTSKGQEHYDVSEFSCIKCGRAGTDGAMDAGIYHYYILELEYKKTGEYQEHDLCLRHFYRWDRYKVENDPKGLIKEEVIHTIKEITELTGLPFKAQESTKHFLDGSEFQT